MRTILLLLPLVFHSYALTMRTMAGSESFTGRTITMDMESRMACFYETLKKDMNLKLSANNLPLNLLAPISMRLTSPSASFSDWANGEGSASMVHNTTESGDYEICVNVPSAQRVTLEIFFFHPTKLEKSFDEQLEVNEISQFLSESIDYVSQFSFQMYSDVKYCIMISLRDEAMQISNSFYIKAYVIVFCVTYVVVAFIQVVIVRRMFFVDPKRMRV